MKKTLLSVVFIATSFTLKSQIGVGTTSPNAALEIISNTSGVIIPNMDSTTRAGLTVNADQNSMMVYDTDTKSFWYYEHTSTDWVEISVNSLGKFEDGNTATDAVYTAGKVGIGTASPSVKLEVDGYIKVGSSDPTGDVTPVNGMIRYNNTTSTFQAYVSGAWVDLH